VADGSQVIGLTAAARVADLFGAADRVACGLHEPQLEPTVDVVAVGAARIAAGRGDLPANPTLLPQPCPETDGRP
jgi:hypothetical protein